MGHLEGSGKESNNGKAKKLNKMSTLAKDFLFSHLKDFKKN